MARMSTKNQTWYEEGLCFACQPDCVDCCTGTGDVWVDAAEIRAIADSLEMGEKEFRRTCTRREGLRISLREKGNEDCVFLGREGCTIYSVRPTQCRQFPFWPDHLRSSRSWESTGRRCPGVGRGRRYTREEIDEIRTRQSDAATPRPI